MLPVAGDLIGGKYRIVRLIGDGGMGSVYEARHEGLRTEVALKFLHEDLAGRPGLSERFLQEARVAATIRSPHVAHVTGLIHFRNHSRLRFICSRSSAGSYRTCPPRG